MKFAAPTVNWPNFIQTTLVATLSIGLQRSASLPQAVAGVINQPDHRPSIDTLELYTPPPSCFEWDSYKNNLRQYVKDIEPVGDRIDMAMREIEANYITDNPGQRLS